MRGALLIAFVGCACSSFTSGSASPASDAGTPTPSPDAAVATVDSGADSAVAACAANVETDGVNCGSCGHSCLGGGCTNGACQPDVVARFKGNGTVIGVAATSTRVAWLYHDENTNPALAVAAHDATGVSVTTFVDPTAITASADAIFAAGEAGSLTTIVRIGATDSGPTQIFNPGNTGYVYPGGLFAGSDGLYVIDPDETNSAVYRLPFDATTMTAPTIVDMFSNSFASLTDVVVAAGMPFARNGNGIWVFSTPTNDPTTFCSYTANCSQGANAMTTDGTNIFWSDFNGNVNGCAAAPTCPAPMKYATPSSIPEATTSLAWDGAHLVLGTAPGVDAMAKIYVCAPTACAQKPTPVVREATLAGRIFSAADALYWIADDGMPSGSSGFHAYRVMRLAK